MINNEIKAKTVKLINESKGVTEVSLEEALNLAREKNLDLISLTHNAEIPTVKIADYSKFMYEKKKKEKEAKKKQKANVQEVKEIRITCNIAEHDLKVKAKNIDRLLKENNKVIIVIKYKGRLVKLIDGGVVIIDKLLRYITYNYKIYKELKVENDKVTIGIIPD